MKNETKALRAHSQGTTAEKTINQAACLQMCEWILRNNRPRSCFLLAGFLSLLLVGCTQDDSLSRDGEETSMSISSLSLAGTGTKSTTTIVTNSVSLGAFRLAANGYTAQSNVQYTYSTAKPGWSTTSPIILNTATASVCAYYPYGAAGITGSTDPTAVTLTSQKYDAAQDLCYATNVTTLSSSSPTATFAMQRAYAQLTLTITRTPSFTGTGNITNIVIANAGILSSASFKITDGTFNSTTPRMVSFNPGIASITSGTPVTTSVLMVPVTTAMTGNLDLIFTVDGKTMTASLPASANNLTTLVAGNKYNINIQLGSSTSNCYIVAPSTSLSILVGIKGNGESTSAALASLSPTHTAASVGVVWQTTSGLITLSGFSATSQTVTVMAGSTSGNAVIAAYSGANQTGTILWSWHIWVTSYNPNTKLNGTTYSYTPTTGITNVFMDRNLGAMTTTYVNDANMLHYQWGRKDPFPAAAVVNASGTSTSVDVTTTTAQSMLWSSQNPFKFINTNLSPRDWCSTSSDYYWMGTSGTTTTPGVKTIYDPCPAGWRVPAWRSGVSPWNGLTSYQQATTYWGANGYNWITTPGIGFYPAAGCRDYNSGALSDVGSYGYFWSASPYSSLGYFLYFGYGVVNPSASYLRAYGFSVRCVQE
jgi:uncharacterized protein (TIGR02145 family)